MKVTLIKPNIGRLLDGPYVDTARMEPLQLGVIAALTPKDVELALRDDRCEAIPFDSPTDLVAITVETFTALRAYEIADAYRARGVRVILGGVHVTLVPDEAAEHADAIYTGDAEFQWPQVIDDARRGALKKVYNAPTGVPQPKTLTRRDLFAGKGYLPLTLLQYSRGCRFECAFCAVSAFFHKTHHRRPVDEVLAEIRAQRRKLLFFVDDSMLCSHDAAKELFRTMIPLNVRWVSQATIDMTADRELMDLMVRSGCLGHVIGFESLDPDNLRAAKKASNFSTGGVDYGKQLEVLREFGLQTWAAFTLGYDHDTVESVERTVQFAIDNKFCFAAFNILMPYPGTPLYETLRREDRLLFGGKWWLDPAYRFNHAAFRPARMSPEELTTACFRARQRFNSVSSIFRRLFDFKTNLRTPYRLGIYLRYNPLFRRETFRKQGMLLGQG